MRRPSLKAAEFQKALGTRPVARTAHFVLHHLPHRAAELSTDAMPADGTAVDESILPIELPGWRLGLVLPKRLARRSVTRSLLRHQARASVERHSVAVEATLWAQQHPADAWVLRLRAPFDRQTFPSAASVALNQTVRAELDELWTALCKKRPS